MDRAMSGDMKTRNIKVRFTNMNKNQTFTKCDHADNPQPCYELEESYFFLAYNTFAFCCLGRFPLLCLGLDFLRVGSSH